MEFRLSRRRGFTLLEIIVSVSILLLLSGLFIVNYNGFSSSQNVKQAASGLMANLQAARTRAAVGAKPSTCDTLIGYNVAFLNESTYTVQALCDSGTAGDIQTYTLPTGVLFFPVPADITFYALNHGTKSDETITLEGNNVTMTVSVLASGVVSVYGPTPTP